MLLATHYLDMPTEIVAAADVPISDTVAPAHLTDLEVAMATLQYIFSMAISTHLTMKSASATMEDTLISPGVRAFVSLQQLLSHNFNSALALLWMQRSYSFSVDQLFSSVDNVLLEPCVTNTRFPFQAAYIAEVGAAEASCLI